MYLSFMFIQNSHDKQTNKKCVSVMVATMPQPLLPSDLQRIRCCLERWMMMMGVCCNITRDV